MKSIECAVVHYEEMQWIRAGKRSVGKYWHCNRYSLNKQMCITSTLPRRQLCMQSDSFIGVCAWCEEWTKRGNRKTNFFFLLRLKIVYEREKITTNDERLKRGTLSAMCTYSKSEMKVKRMFVLQYTTYRIIMTVATSKKQTTIAKILLLYLNAENIELSKKKRRWRKLYMFNTHQMRGRSK